MQVVLIQKQGKYTLNAQERLKLGGHQHFYLPISTVNFVHNFSNNDLLFNGIFEFLVFWVLVDFQVSSLEWLPNTKGEKNLVP